MKPSTFPFELGLINFMSTKKRPNIEDFVVLVNTAKKRLEFNVLQSLISCNHIMDRPGKNRSVQIMTIVHYNM